MKKRLSSELLLLSVILCFTACNLEQNKKKSEEPEQPKQAFTLPDIPSTLVNPMERAAYLLTHYWEHFNFADTSLVSRPEISEQEFVNFISLFPTVPMDTTTKAVSLLLDAAMNANNNMFDYFTKLSETYLYDPNSPFLNEEYYIPFVQYIVSSPKVDEINKIRPAHQLEMAMKNRPGMIATDLTYTLRNGKRAKLSDLTAEYTVLFFNNPDCHDCKRVKTYMTNSPVLNNLLRKNKMSQQKMQLAILAIYPDEDLTIWLKAEYPREWINGYDAKKIIETEQLYDLKAIPTFYLLDKDKRVIMKDAPIEAIEQYLSNIAMTVK